MVIEIVKQWSLLSTEHIGYSSRHFTYLTAPPPPRTQARHMYCNYFAKGKTKFPEDKVTFWRPHGHDSNVDLGHRGPYPSRTHCHLNLCAEDHTLASRAWHTGREGSKSAPRRQLGRSQSRGTQQQVQNCVGWWEREGVLDGGEEPGHAGMRCIIRPVETAARETWTCLGCL